MSSPWAKISQPEAVNLDDIMSEEVARDLQTKEYKIHMEETAEAEAPVDGDVCEACDIPPELLTDSDLETDAEIAKMLQQQYDKEYDDELKRTEDKFNGSCKVSISFDNYRRVPMNNDFESDSEEEEPEDMHDRKGWESFYGVQQEFRRIPPCGYRVKNGNMVTKHDMAMSAQRNACKMMSFPPEFETGDGARYDLKLSNKVFNSLKVHSKREQVRRHRIHDRREDRATAEFGMDEFTTLQLYKMINNQLLERVNGVISIGKEAVVLHADSDQSRPEALLPKECVIKVFKTTLSEYKQRDKYIRDDYRFKDRMKTEQSTRKTVHLWAEKEMHNLNRLQRAGIPCPQVVTLKKHILVMSFIGHDHRAAPKLKNAGMSAADYIIAYDQVVEAMKLLFTKANLIHADLSEYNILWHEGQCYIIDVSQAVEPSHENAFHFLMRDCRNINNFFSKRGVPEVASPEQLFMDITGCDFNHKLHLLEMQESFKMKPHFVDRPGKESTYRFENAWDKSKLPTAADGPPVMIEGPPIVDPMVA